MSLLAKLCERKETRDMFNVTKVAPRLWPFATHPIASVREAMWQTISELAGTLLENDSFVEAHLADFMTLSLQGCALDEDDGVNCGEKGDFIGSRIVTVKMMLAKKRHRKSRNFQNQSRCVFERFERATERATHITRSKNRQR